MEILNRILKAEFRQYSDNDQVLKVKFQSGFEQEIKKGAYDRCINKDAVEFLWNSFNFQADLILVDNRNEEDYRSDFNNQMNSRLINGITTAITYEDWLTAQKQRLTF